MDIRSLKIGDIVTTNGIPACSKRGDFYRIVAIDSKDNFTDKKGVKHIGNVSLESVEDKYAYIGGAWVDYLEPIPITDELPKKNGLRLKESNGGMIKYLHDLQHKMFDAGIESEIKI